MSSGAKLTTMDMAQLAPHVADGIERAQRRRELQNHS